MLLTGTANGIMMSIDNTECVHDLVFSKSGRKRKCINSFSLKYDTYFKGYAEKWNKIYHNINIKTALLFSFADEK